MEKINWHPTKKENEFVNKVWELSGLPSPSSKDAYTFSFEALDCLFRNIYRVLNSEPNPERSDATGLNSSNEAD